MSTRFLSLIAMILAVAASSFAIDVKIGMESWFRYTAPMGDLPRVSYVPGTNEAGTWANIAVTNAAKSYGYEAGLAGLQKSYVSVERCYVNIEPTFNDFVKGRFTLDFFTAASTSFVDGVGTKMKYAYLDFNLNEPAGTGELLPTLTVGLQKTYFGRYYDYNYEVIDKYPLDANKANIYIGTKWEQSKAFNAQKINGTNTTAVITNVTVVNGVITTNTNFASYQYSTTNVTMSNQYTAYRSKQAGTFASSSMGVSLFGFIPEGFGEYSLQVINGEGYKAFGAESLAKVDISPCFIANLRLIPVAGITLGGSFAYEVKNIEQYVFGKTDVSDLATADYDRLSIETNLTNGAKHTLVDGRMDWTGNARIAFGPVDFVAEYFGGQWFGDNGGALNNMYLGVMGLLQIYLAQITDGMIDIDLVGRFDYWDPNTAVVQDRFKINPADGTLGMKEDAYIVAQGGLNYNIVRDGSGGQAVWLQLNYVKKSYLEQPLYPGQTKKSDEDTIMAQLRWKFSGIAK